MGVRALLFCSRNHIVIVSQVPDTPPPTYCIAKKTYLFAPIRRPTLIRRDLLWTVPRNFAEKQRQAMGLFEMNHRSEHYLR